MRRASVLALVLPLAGCSLVHSREEHRECTGLSAPEHGSVDRTSGLEGDVVSYSCGPGYELSGAATRLCEASATWTGDAPTCIRERPRVELPERDFVCAAGEPQPCETTQDAHTVEERTHGVGDELDDATFTFVINGLSLPEAEGGQAAGFNLDGMDSGEGSTHVDATCEEYNADFRSLRDPDHVGVDNAFQSLVSMIEGFFDPAECPGGSADGCLDAHLLRQINTGEVIFLVEVTGVESLEYDAAVEVELFRAATPGSGACSADIDCTRAGERCIETECRPAPRLGGDGHIASGQTFEALEPFGSPVTGDIFAGRIRATALSMRLPIALEPGEGFELEIAIRELRFDISEEGLVNGQIGGVYPTPDDCLCPGLIEPGIADTIRNVINGIADVSPSTSDPAICEAASVGILAEGTLAYRY